MVKDKERSRQQERIHNENGNARMGACLTLSFTWYSTTMRRFLCIIFFSFILSYYTILFYIIIFFSFSVKSCQDMMISKVPNLMYEMISSLVSFATKFTKTSLFCETNTLPSFINGVLCLT